MKSRYSLSICLFSLFFIFGIHLPGMAQTDSLPPASAAPSDWDVAVEALDLSQQANGLKDSFALQLDQLHTQRKLLERALEHILTDTTATADSIKSLKAEVKAIQNEEKNLEKYLKKAEKTAEFASSVANMDTRQQKPQVPKVRKQVQQIEAILHPPAPEEKQDRPKKGKKQQESTQQEEQPAISEVIAASEKDSSDTKITTSAATESNDKRKSKVKVAEEPKTAFAVYSVKEDVMINPPVAPCALAAQIRDEFSGEVRKEMPGKEIFRYTNQALRKIYKNRAHTIGEAALLSVGPNAALLLTLQIQDPNVRRTQGVLTKNGTATLKFMDGSSIILYNQRADEGATAEDGQSVRFQAQFPIDRTTIKKIRSTELDKIRLAWSNGYEDYDVQQVDMLMWQAKCLFE